MEKKLPKEWASALLEELGEQKYYAIGDGDHGKIKPYMYQDSGIPYIRVGDMGWGNFSTKKLVYISKEIHENNLKSELLPGDILIAKTGATIGKCCIVPNYIERANTTSSVGKVSVDKKLTSSKWILYYFLSPSFFKLMWSHSNRTAQPGFNNRDLKKFPVPLPPLAEQQRIVAKLDELFGHLDSLKKRLENIPTLLKNLKQAILTQAVTGKLTQEWRVGKDIKKSTIQVEVNDDFLQYELPEVWVNSIIKNIGSVKGGKRLPKGEKLVAENTGYPYIRAGNLKKGTVVTTNLMYLLKSTQEKIKRYTVKTNDVYITIVGAKIGDAGIIPKEMNCANLTENAAKITDFNNELNATYFSLFLRSSICQNNIQSAIMSAAQGKLALTRIKTLPIYLPPTEEQTEIVKRVEDLFTKADTIETQYQSLKTKIDNLPQAILAKAFKGELVKQLDTDGDAKELLAEIQALKESLAKKPVKGKKKTKK